MKNTILLILFSIIITSCANERKFQKSIELIDSWEGYSHINISEGRGNVDNLPLVNDSVISYLVSSSTGQHIQKLILNVCPQVTQAGFNKLSELKRLKNLEIYFHDISGKQVNKLVEACDSLESLMFYECKNIDSLKILNRKQPINLHITKCPALKKIRMENLPENCIVNISRSILGKAFTLDLKACPNPSIGFSFEEISDDFNIVSDRLIRKLQFSSSSFTGDFQSIVTGVNKVVNLNLYDIPVEELSLSGLTELGSFQLYNSSDSTLEKTTVLKKVHLHNLPSLVHLSIVADSLEEVRFNNLPNIYSFALHSDYTDFRMKNTEYLDNMVDFQWWGAEINDNLLSEIVSLPLLRKIRYWVEPISTRQSKILLKSENLGNISLLSLENQNDIYSFLQKDNILFFDIETVELSTLKIINNNHLQSFRLYKNAKLDSLIVDNCSSLQQMILSNTQPKSIMLNRLPMINTVVINPCRLNNKETFESKLKQLNTITYLELKECEETGEIQTSSQTKL